MPTRSVRLEHCATGRLRDTYPVSTHDVEVRVTDEMHATGEFAAVLGAAVREVLDSDPRCRRVVFAAPVGDLDTIAAAEAAGFRYVVDVDIPGAELSLLVVEPDWAVTVDMDLDRVPGT